MASVQDELRTARLTALQNQIVPHYIVNSLDVIRMKLILDGQTESADLLLRLQNSLKTYGFSPDATVSVAQEMEQLKAWLKLQEFRYLGKLSCVFSVSPGAEELQIPRFLLQPIIENSIRHGLTPDMDAPQLRISVWVEADMLCLSVADNGMGFSGEASSRGIGLSNVRERTALLYGDACAMEVKSTPGSGTSVTLRLPEKGKVNL